MIKEKFNKYWFKYSVMTKSKDAIQTFSDNNKIESSNNIHAIIVDQNLELN